MPMDSRKFERWTRAVSIIVAVVVGVYGAVAFIDSRIEKKLADEVVLKKVAELVRPSCIFDERGSVLFDSGAMQSIDEIKLEGLKTEGEYGQLPFKIVIRPKRFLRDAPLLTVLDAYSPEITAERGEKFDWVYSIRYVGYGETSKFKKCRYRLEVL